MHTANSVLEKHLKAKANKRVKADTSPLEAGYMKIGLGLFNFP